jgi:regulator of protease activity HflC (stomatin/prohibitin superfamily)
MRTVHFSINLTVNEDSSWNWGSPKVQETLQFSVPVEMLEAKNLSAMIVRAIEEMEKRFPDAVLEYEAEKAAEEAEKEKAKVEAEA